MKRILTLAVVAPLVAVGVAVAVPAPKVTICHATSAEDNPWVRIVVSENAIGGHFENPGTPKAGHEDDVLLQGDVECPVPEEPNEEPETPVTPPPVVTSTPEVLTQEPVIEAGK